jgi:enamine deaminase RidA (YjgF/YER057c/UK114 family)
MENDGKVIQVLNVGLSYSRVVSFSNLLFLSGVVDSKGISVTEQLENILVTIKKRLEENGSSLSSLLSVTIYLSDIGNFQAVDLFWREKFSGNNLPARTTVESRLSDPKFFIEVQAIAAKNLYL